VKEKKEISIFLSIMENNYMIRIETFDIALKTPEETLRNPLSRWEE
jgi:hypothetical protein